MGCQFSIIVSEHCLPGRWRDCPHWKRNQYFTFYSIKTLKFNSHVLIKENYHYLGDPWKSALAGERLLHKPGNFYVTNNASEQTTNAN